LELKVICWSCERDAGAGVLCGHCKAVQPPDERADAFAVLGLPRRYAVDLEAAEAAFKQLSRQVHPDRYAKADPRARKAALARTVQLNEAWKTIKDPIARAEHMLARAGVDIGRGDAAVDGAKETREVMAPPAFLLEILERNDELMEAKLSGDSVKVAFMAEEMRGRAAESLRLIATGLEAASRADLEAAAKAVVALRYQRRFIETAEGTGRGL
jgi:molecular chaperone HscB